MRRDLLPGSQSSPRRGAQCPSHKEKEKKSICLVPDFLSCHKLTDKRVNHEVFCITPSSGVGGLRRSSFWLFLPQPAGTSGSNLDRVLRGSPEVAAAVKRWAEHRDRRGFTRETPGDEGVS